jgi:hypothetical protein
VSAPFVTPDEFLCVTPVEARYQGRGARWGDGDRVSDGADVIIDVERGELRTEVHEVLSLEHAVPGRR